MAEFVFDPPLRLTRGVTVRTLDQAAAFVRGYVDIKLPRRRDSVLHQLEAASGHLQERDAAYSFRLWAKAEGLLEEK